MIVVIIQTITELNCYICNRWLHNLYSSLYSILISIALNLILLFYIFLLFYYILFYIQERSRYKDNEWHPVPAAAC